MSAFWFRWIAFAGFALWCGLIQAQQSEIHHFGVEEGLPQTTIRAIGQDKFGQIWVGTGGGLASFDGRAFRRYLPEANGKNGLKEEYISDLKVLQDGKVVVLTPQALHLMDPRGLELRVMDKGEGAYCSLLHSVCDTAVVFFNQDHFERIGVQSRSAWEISRPSIGYIHYLGPREGRGTFLQRNDTLWMVDQNMKYHVVKIPQAIKGRGILHHGNGDYFFGEGGMLAISSDDGRIVESHFLGEEVRGVLKLKSGGWAVAIRGVGLHICEDDFSIQRTYDHSFFRKFNQTWRLNEVQFLFQDKEENIWIGTNEEGLFCLTKAKVKFDWVNAAEGKLAGPMVRSLKASGDTVWIGSYQNGITQHDLKSGQSRFYLPGISVNEIWNKGSHLILATDRGLYTRRGNNFVPMIWPGKETECRRILPVPDTDSLIVLAQDGIYHLHVSGRGRRASTLIFPSAFALEGKILLKHHKSGLVVWEQDKDPLNGPRFLPEHVVNDVLSDASGRWVATRKGLLRVDTSWNIQHHYTVSEGLPDNYIYMILSDKNGRLWLSTNRGLSCLDPRTGLFRNYQPDDGLQSLEFNTNAACRGLDGRLFFGGVNGINHFLPEKVQDNPHAPDLILRNLRISDFHVPFLPADHLPLHFELPYGKYDLDSEVSLIDFAQPGGNLFSSWLEGLESDFQSHAPGSALRYASLGPGKYKLHLRSINADGHTSPPRLVLAFEILPPFWATWWFSVLIVLGTGLVLTIGVRRWTRRQYEKQLRNLELQREIEKVRQRISQDMHDDLGAGLTKLAIMAERLKTTPDGQTQIMAVELGREVRSINEEMRNILSTVSPAYDTLPDFLAYLRHYAGDYLERVGLDYQFRFPKDVPDRFVHPDKRHALISVVKECLNNIAKHAQATLVEIKVQLEGSTLQLTVRDNGTGIQSHHGRSGHGLKNMQARIEQQKGAFEIVTSPAGTEIACTLNLDLTQNGEKAELDKP